MLPVLTTDIGSKFLLISKMDLKDMFEINFNLT